MVKRMRIVLFIVIVIVMSINSDGISMENNYKEIIEAKCGEHKIIIKCGYNDKLVEPGDNRKCNDNILSFVASDGKVNIPEIPK